MPAPRYPNRLRIDPALSAADPRGIGCPPARVRRAERSSLGVGRRREAGGQPECKRGAPQAQHSRSLQNLKPANAGRAGRRKIGPEKRLLGHRRSPSSVHRPRVLRVLSPDHARRTPTHDQIFPGLLWRSPVHLGFCLHRVPRTRPLYLHTSRRTY